MKHHIHPTRRSESTGNRRAPVGQSASGNEHVKTVGPRRQGVPSIYSLVVFLSLLTLVGLSSNVRAQDDPCECMDIVLVVDETGGMRHVVREIKQRAADITAAAAGASNDVRVGLVIFDEAVRIRLDLTSDLSAIEAAIGRLQAAGGGADPENWDGALNYSASRDVGFFYPGGPPCQVDGALDLFRAACRKLVVLITDAPPSGCNDAYEDGVDDVRVYAIADAAAANGVIVSTILSDNGDTLTATYPGGVERALLSYCADTTGGTFAIVPDVGPDGAIAIQNAIAAQACPPAPPEPTVTIIDPEDGSAFPSDDVVDFTATAADYLGNDVSHTIEWFLNDELTAFDTGASTSLDFSSIGDGVHTITAEATDPNGTGSDAVTISVGAPPSASTVSVDSITYATSGGRLGDKHLLVTVSLVDEASNPVGGASVSIDLLRDESLDSQATGTTGADGTVTFERKNAPSGIYTTEVTDVTAAGLTWDGLTPSNSFTK